MSFRKNLLQKLEIDSLANRVTDSMGPVDSGRRIDRDLARQLIDIAGYERIDKRDLELYLIPPVPPQVLVLDNDFSIYNTTPDDVALRKSPIVKEMVKIRNIIKILNDKDVVISKKGDSVERVRSECVAALDLTHTPEDITEIERQGVDALAGNYGEGVIETLTLFAELTGLARVPGALKIPHHILFGKRVESPDTGRAYGPLFLFDRVHNTLKLIDKVIRSADKVHLQSVREVADGAAEASAEGPAVFASLKKAVLEGQYIPS